MSPYDNNIQGDGQGLFLGGDVAGCDLRMMVPAISGGVGPDGKAPPYLDGLPGAIIDTGEAGQAGVSTFTLREILDQEKPGPAEQNECRDGGKTAFGLVAYEAGLGRPEAGDEGQYAQRP